MEHETKAKQVGKLETIEQFIAINIWRLDGA